MIPPLTPNKSQGDDHLLVPNLKSRQTGVWDGRGMVEEVSGLQSEDVSSFSTRSLRSVTLTGCYSSTVSPDLRTRYPHWFEILERELREDRDDRGTVGVRDSSWCCTVEVITTAPGLGRVRGPEDPLPLQSMFDSEYTVLHTIHHMNALV